MAVTANPRRRFSSDPAWRASRLIGHVLVAQENKTLKLTPFRHSVFQAALSTPGVTDRLIEQGKRCWQR